MPRVMSTVAASLPPYAAPSAPVLGTVTTPGGNAVIATTGVLAAGSYEVEVAVSYGTTGDIANNMTLRVGGTVVCALLLPPTVNGAVSRFRFARVDVDGTQAITVNAGAVVTAAAVYNALIVATQLA